MDVKFSEEAVELMRTLSREFYDLLTAGASTIASKNGRILATPTEVQEALGEIIPINRLEPEPTAYKQYTRLRARIGKFAANLDGKSEILVMVAGFTHFQALRIYYEEPYTVVFVGETDHGGAAEVVQHVNQMGVMLAGVPCPSRRPKRRIEFGPPLETE